MKKVRVTEVFYSVQGEGYFTGAPSIFIRLFGCNLTCPFGQEPKPVDYTKVKNITELKASEFDRGCDSQYAWAEEARNLSPETSVDELIHQVLALNQGELWANDQPLHIVFTGGEPLLRQSFILEFLAELDAYCKSKGIKTLNNITFETNSTVTLKSATIDYLNYWNTTRLWSSVDNIVWSNSPKLSFAGDPVAKRINVFGPSTQRQIPLSKQVFKFVVRDNTQDFKEIKTLLAVFEGTKELIYVMPLAGTLDQQKAICEGVVKKCLVFGYHYCHRVHLSLFGNELGT